MPYTSRVEPWHLGGFLRSTPFSCQQKEAILRFLRAIIVRCHTCIHGPRSRIPNLSFLHASYDDGDFREEVPLREVRPIAVQAAWGSNLGSSSGSSLAGIAAGGVSGAEAAALRAELARFKAEAADHALARRSAELALQRAEAGRQAAEAREAFALAQGLAAVQQAAALEVALGAKERDVHAAQQAALQVHSNF
jgi:hypothetical protein